MKNPKGEVKLLTHLNWRLFVKDEAKRYSNRTSRSGTSKLSTKKNIFMAYIENEWNEFSMYKPSVSHVEMELSISTKTGGGE